MTISAEEFKQALQCWASGVSVVTTNSERFGLQGMTVSSFASVSVEPPQILVCLNETAETRQGIENSECFAVNMLTAEQETVSNQFAGGDSMEARFENTSWVHGQTGAPLLTGSLAALDCKVIQQIQAGTHWIVIGEVQDMLCQTGEPLLYYRAGYRRLLL